MKKKAGHIRISFYKKIIGVFLISSLVWFVYLISTLFFVSFFDISGRSMEPTLFTGDNIIIDQPVLGSRITNPLAALKGAEAQTGYMFCIPAKARKKTIITLDIARHC